MSVQNSEHISLALQFVASLFWLIGAALASILQPIALLSLDYILVILHSDGITKNFIDSQMWRDIVPMLTPGSFVRFYFCQPNFKS